MNAEPVDWIGVLSSVLLLVAAVLSLAAGVGLLRFPDALTRLHAATKPQILGLICVLAAVALESGNWLTLTIIVPTVLLQMLTSPMAAHMVGRTAYRTDNFRRDLVSPDELADDIERAHREAEEDRKA